MDVTALESHNGIVVSGSKDATVKIWDIEKKKGWTF
jgi:WD40 repeat protein